MTLHDTHLRSRADVARGTTSFRFDKPAGFAFEAGQAIDLIVPGLPEGADRHTFSIVTAPHEAELAIATRMRDSAYKRALGALPDGAPLRLDGPSGSLVLDPDPARAAVFIAGGIGITPFLSMLRASTRSAAPPPIVLLYSNRTPADAPFLAELQQLERDHGHFKLIATMTQARQAAEPWPGRHGMIDEALLRGAAAGLAAPVYYLAGPPAMVEALWLTLEDAGIDAGDVRSEEFYGY